MTPPRKRLIPETCAVLILAAGLSTRFGAQDKLCADINGRPVLDYVTQICTPFSFAQKYAVITPLAHARRDIFEKAGYIPVENITPEAGQGSSLACGLAAIQNTHCESILILLGDMPLISPEHITHMFKASPNADIIMSQMGNIYMPPVLCRRSAVTALTLSGDRGAKSAFKDQDIYTVALHPDMGLDIDSPEDLSHARNLLANSDIIPPS